jgi:type I restriction enzyme, S subunit
VEVKPGYKQTEVGIIPEEWYVKSVRDVGQIKTGPFGTMLKAKEYSGTEGVPLISVGEVGPGTFKVTEHTPRVPDAVVRRLPQYVLRSGDIVFGRKGAVERSALVTDAEDGWFLGSDGISIRPQRACYPPYLAWQFQRFDVQAWLLQNATGTTMASLNQGILNRVQILYAPMAEQRAIAEALSDVDALLDVLDRLITKKRGLKQAAMQQLLTCQTRLPGFHGKWQSSTLKQAANICTGINKPLSEMGSGALYVTVQDLYDGTSIRTERMGRIQVSPAEIEAKKLEVGDIVFGKSSVKRDGIGYPSQFLGCGEPAVFSGFTYRARARQGIADATFLFYSLRSRQTRQWLIDNSQASALTNINQRIADAIPLTLPPLPEQTAIATVLSDMDAELAALEQRRDKTRALKQGMMQELLTGRTRLV